MTDEIEPVTDDVRTDVMMRDFKGHKIIMLIGAAVLVHVVIILASSFGYIRNEVFGADTTGMSKEDRVKVALGEATSALAQIVERHDLTVDDVLDKLAATGSRAERLQGGAKPEAAPEEGPAPAAGATTPEAPQVQAPERKLSELERNLPQATPGPKAPKINRDDNTGL